MAKFNVAKSIAANVTFKNVVRALVMTGMSVAAATAMATQAFAQVSGEIRNGNGNQITNQQSNPAVTKAECSTAVTASDFAPVSQIGMTPPVNVVDPAAAAGQTLCLDNNIEAQGGAGGHGGHGGTGIGHGGTGVGVGGSNHFGSGSLSPSSNSTATVGDLTNKANQYLESNPTATVGDVASHLNAHFQVSPQISNDIAATAKQQQQQRQTQQAQAEANNFVQANPQATSGDVAAHLNSKNFNSLEPTMINRIANDAVATGGNVSESGNSKVDTSNEANNGGNVLDASDNSSSTYRNETTYFNPPALPPAVPGSAGRTFRVVTPSGEVLLQENAVVTQRGINASLLINGNGGNFQSMTPVIVGEENITDLGDTPVRAFDAIIGTIQPQQPVQAVTGSGSGSGATSEASVIVNIDGQPTRVIRRGNR